MESSVTNYTCAFEAITVKMSAVKKVYNGQRKKMNLAFDANHVSSAFLQYFIIIILSLNQLLCDFHLFWTYRNNMY